MPHFLHPFISPDVYFHESHMLNHGIRQHFAENKYMAGHYTECCVPQLNCFKGQILSIHEITIVE